MCFNYNLRLGSSIKTYVLLANSPCFQHAACMGPCMFCQGPQAATGCILVPNAPQCGHSTTSKDHSAWTALFTCAVRVARYAKSTSSWKIVASTCPKVSLLAKIMLIKVPFLGMIIFAIQNIFRQKATTPTVLKDPPKSQCSLLQIVNCTCLHAAFAAHDFCSL